MATKIAITNAKGGVGKTTTALNIADALMYIGYKVLFIDLDPQANSTSVYEGSISRRPGEKTLLNVMEKKNSLSECIEHTAFGDIVPGDPKLADQDAVYTTKIGGTNIVKNALKEVDGLYDFVVMDTPPNIGAYMRNAIYAADGCICPVLPKKFAIDGLNQLLDTIKSIKDDGNQNLKIYGILLTIYDKRNSQDRALKEQLPVFGKELGFHVFKTPIRTCQDVEKALAECKSLFRTKGNSNGAMDYAALVQELLEVL
ncbi:ParA family protein [Bilifractor sp. LCP19S3_H10]|uniref:ParA family protein n=1 Tax=Bilifractor sp. LCP19S3_H10 TaxID=3438736 RepID=UPI003F91E98E